MFFDRKFFFPGKDAVKKPASLNKDDLKIIENLAATFVRETATEDQVFRMLKAVYLLGKAAGKV